VDPCRVDASANLGLCSIAVLSGLPVHAKQAMGRWLLGFLALVGFAYLVGSAVNHSQFLPAVVALSA
jgi:hypothetical protein